MDKDKVKGTMDDAVGRAKRQVGEWTGDTKTQVEGAAQQVKGKAEKAWGNVKDAARDAKDSVHNAANNASQNRDAKTQAEIDREEREREHAVAGHDKRR
ncbi:MAG TPA: CsbD family protein [Terracidiphilus sp.]|jgi:uncharacterized protein YjbJ (UPF0337 family)|nr:CsbD family protein [Terracidiphilus sp.]